MPDANVFPIIAVVALVALVALGLGFVVLSLKGGSGSGRLSLKKDSVEIEGKIETTSKEPGSSE